MTPTMTTDTHGNYQLTHPNLHKALQMYMHMVGTNGKFTFSEDLEEKINKMALYFKDEDACYTNFESVVIGLLFQYFTNDINENFNIAKGIIGHEVGHLRLTSKKEWDNFCNTAIGKYKKLASVATDMLNIVEDDRIEYWMAKISKFLKDAFYLLCQRMAENIQKSFDDMDMDVEMTATQKIMIIRNATLFIRCTQRLPKIKDKELMGYLEEIYPYMIYGRVAKSTKRAVQVTHKIMEIISPLREEFEDNEEDRMEGMYSKDSKGSNSPTENSGLEKLDKSPGKGSKSKDKKDKDDSDEPKKVKELKKKIVKKVAKELGDDDEAAKEDKDAKEKAEKEDETSKDKSAGSSEKDGDKSEKEKDKSKSGTAGQVDEDDDKSDNANKPGSNQDGKKEDKDSKDSEYGPASGEEDDNKSLRDYVDDITENLDKYAADIDAKVKERTATLRQEARKPVTRDIIGDYMKSNKKTEKQKMKETLEDKKIVELKPVLINPGIHLNCKSVFRGKEHMIPFTDAQYAIYVEENIEVIKSGAKELLKLSEEKRQSKMRMQRRGKLDSRRLISAAAFGSEDVYYKKNIEKNKIGMDVFVFIDRSGSNNSIVLNEKNDIRIHRYEMNRMAAIIQHEMLKRAKIDHAVWSFEEQGWNNVFSPMIDFANCFESDSGLYLADIGASGANRDGYCIATAGDYLLKHGKNQKKLLIVISDGQPSGIGYGGQVAMNDVKNTVKDLAKKGIKTIGVFTGSATENAFFEKMYENHLFFNNDNISKMPEELRKKISAEFKDYLRTF